MVQNNGDRRFMAQTGEEFLLPSKAVNGLLKMNQFKRSEPFDGAFLKAMLIGFCTLLKIKRTDFGLDDKLRGVIEGA